MASVWYTGRSTTRSISAAQWLAAGVGVVVDTVWSPSNGWSIDEATFNAPQLALLDAAGDFQTGAADGPRPGGAVSSGAADPYPQYLLPSELEGALPSRLTEPNLITLITENAPGGGGGVAEVLNIIETLPDPTNDEIGTWTILDDGSSTAGWPDRFKVVFDPVTGETVATFTLNEYGETRIISGKPTTIPFRVFEKQYTASTAHSVGVAILQVMNDRDNRVEQWAVYPGGKMVVASTIVAGGNVTAPNIGAKVVTWPTGSEPTLVGVADGTLWVEYTP